MMTIAFSTLERQFRKNARLSTIRERLPRKPPSLVPHLLTVSGHKHARRFHSSYHCSNRSRCRKAGRNWQREGQP
jgi:hypothetical protein